MSEDEWFAIQRELLTPSALEIGGQSKSAALIEALGALEGLDKITRNSLAPPAASSATAAPTPTPAPAPTQAYAQPSRPVPARSPAAFGTARHEYQSALGNQGLIEALLRYHHRAKPKPHSPKGFSSELIPEVEVETKGNPFRRSSGTSAPVLRSKKDPK
ncbi:MAG: hypothetical protein P4M08_12875 [Oligoflexia bacterium]|nr:hypothetical protein [Oligoflexia bacterium]